MGSAVGYVDLRSDTVTRPSPAMRRAMAQAEVGDDLFGDDPTVNRLQDRAAELTGCQAALYLPTGTMCNQIAMHVFARSGHLVVCEQDAHTGGMEVSSSAVLSGIAFHRVAAPSRGLLTAPQVAAALTPDPYGMAVIDLVTIENTHQVGGGSVMGVNDVAAIAKVCADQGLPLYLDGARIFNACTVAGVAVTEYAAHADAMMFCLSKGLGAPIGSVLVGEAEVIRAAGRDHGSGRPDRAHGGPGPASGGPCERPAAGGRRRRHRARLPRPGRGGDQHRVRRRGRPGPSADRVGGGAGGRGRPGLHGDRPAADGHPCRRHAAGRGHRAHRVAPGGRRDRRLTAGAYRQLSGRPILTSTPGE